MSELKKRAVAGSFIFRFPDDDETREPQVALFRRSGAVSTYQHKYAPISGHIEAHDASPLATAWRELHEELLLTPSSLRLFRQGKPFSFTDADVGREWSINPFAFVLKPASEATFSLDWEHESYRWFDPHDIRDESDESGDDAASSFGAVPRLRESLRRVYFELDLGKEAGKVLSEGLRALQQDHDSGARQLAARALNMFSRVIPKLDDDAGDARAWWKNVRITAWHLWKNGRESMGVPILSVVLASLAIIEKKLPSTSGSSLPAGFVDDVISAINEFARTRQQAGSDKVGHAFASFVKQHFAVGETVKILTLSSSSTISSSIAHALDTDDQQQPLLLPPPRLDIRVLESRPLFEGVKTARSIASLIRDKSPNDSSSSGSSVSLYTDASAAIAAQDVDIILLGADLIDKTGNVSNKTGSLPAVLAAKHVSPKARVIVLSDKEKVSPFDPPGQEDNDPREVIQGWADVLSSSSSSSGIEAASSLSGVHVKNVYFEWVGAELIQQYITEDGVESPEDIARWAEHVRRTADGFFNDI